MAINLFGFVLEPHAIRCCRSTQSNWAGWLGHHSMTGNWWTWGISPIHGNISYKIRQALRRLWRLSRAKHFIR